MNVTVVEQFTPRYYQYNAAKAVIDYYLAGNWGKNALVAMPTGTGKSIVISLLIRMIIERWPNTRFGKATHVKELVKQNAEKFHSMLPGYDLGIYSAGLKQKNFHQQFIFGGIGSMVKNPLLFGHRDILLVDEAHLISGNDDTNYGNLIRAWKSVNPRLIVIGFTATKYRMGQGLLTNGDLFDEIVYDDTTLDRFNTLVAEGYLAMLVAPRQDVHIDLKGLKKSSNGDFIQAELEERAMRVTADALNVAAQYKFNRFSWLVFASGVKHCYQVSEMLNRMGISATVIHSNSKEFPITEDERDQRIEDFKQGRYQALVNYNVLTTGFDHKPIDLIVMLRGTDSVPLWVQMLGRGTRPFEGDYLFPRKLNCLVLDFARNTERLGPINDPFIPRIKGGGGGDVPYKICAHCGAYSYISARFCMNCGEAFEIKEKITQDASTAELIRDMTPKIERYRVRRVYCHGNTGRQSGVPYMCVNYDCFENVPTVKENVFIEGQGRARAHAENWWLQRTNEPFPANVQDALYLQSRLRTPTYIEVHVNQQYPTIVRYEYD